MPLPLRPPSSRQAEPGAPVSAPVNTPPPPTVGGDDLQARAENAVGLLANRLQVPEADVEISSLERVTWPDGSAGCPRPGVSYTQALVDGYRVVLTNGGREYHFHGLIGRDPFYCARPGPKSNWIQDR